MRSSRRKSQTDQQALEESDGKKNWKITVLAFTGGAPVKLFDVRPSPLSFAPFTWSSDGKELNYLYRQNGVSNIWSLNLDTGSTKQVTNFVSDRVFYFDWSKDGKRLAIARGNVNQDVVLISDLRQ